MLIILLLMVTVALLAMGIPISLSLIGGAATYLFVRPDLSLVIIPHLMTSGLDSFQYLAIPLFLLAGNIMAGTSIAPRMIGAVGSLVRHRRGGGGEVAILSNIVLAGISGSASADAAATAPLLVRLLHRSGYSLPSAAVLLSAAATIGPVIPPSIPLVIYAGVTNSSVGKLFIAGIIPGLTMGACLFVANYFMARRYNYATEKRASLREIVDAFKAAFLPLFLPIIIVGGIIGGIFTPTEASGAAVIYALLLALLYRDLTWEKFFWLLKETLISTGVIMLMIAAAGVVSWILILEQVDQQILWLFVPIENNPSAILLIINVILLLVGMPLDGISLILLFVPVLMPIVLKAGIDPIHFGIVVVVNIMIAAITPPVGGAMAVTCRIAGITIEQFSGALFPYLTALIAALLIITFWPAASLWLPSMFFK